MSGTEQYLALVRHGQSFANVCTELPTNAHYYEISGSDKSVGITERGCRQSRYSGELLARLFPASDPVETLWVSEFDRIKLTGSIVADRLVYPVGVIEEPRLNKRSYGEFWNLTYGGVSDLHPDQFKLYKELGPMKYRPPGGENYFDLFERVEEFMEGTLDSRRGHQLIVGHLAVILAIQRHIEGISDSEVVRQYERVCIPNGHILLYKRRLKEKCWRRGFIGDTLYGAA